MLTELFTEAAAAILAAGLAALLGYMWRALLRFPPLLLAIGVALLALAVLLVGNVSLDSMRTEGSPAGTIMFVMYGSAVVGAGAVGIFFATLGLVLMTEATGLHPALRAFACFMVVCVLTAIAGVQYHRHVTAMRMAARDAERAADRAAGRPTYDAPPSAMTPYEPHPKGPGAARDLRARQRYDECVAYTRESYRPETLKQCADELVAAWDDSHAANRRFANMPDGAPFAGSIGDMYVAYAAATGDRSGARAGLRGLGERVRARAGGQTPILERLREAEASLQ